MSTVEDQRLKLASDWVFRLREDGVDPAEIAQWIEWCERDAANLAAFEEMEAAWKDLGELPAPAKARLAALASPPSRGPHLPWPQRPLLAAAAIAVAAVLTTFYFWHIQRPQVVVNAVQSAPGRNQDATLPDGSMVALGARSALNIEFGESERRLRMRDGQAYFKVKPDRERPFVVEAGAVEVRAIGTAFDVRKNADRIVVSVSEGVVDVAPRGAKARGSHDDKVRVVAGYQLVWDNGNGEVKLAVANAAAASGWRSGRLEYLGEPLWAVIADVNRYAEHPIELADASVGELQFAGTVFTAAVDDWLQTLPHALAVECERRGDGSVIVRMRR